LIQSIPSHPNTLRSIFILSTHLRLNLPSGLFPSALPQISYMHSSSPHSCYMPCPSHPSLLDHSNYVWRAVQVIKLLVMQFPPISHHFTPLRSKYSPQHPVFKHRQWFLWISTTISFQNTIRPSREFRYEYWRIWESLYNSLKASLI
jgi:hypothetical protein